MRNDPLILSNVLDFPKRQPPRHYIAALGLLGLLVGLAVGLLCGCTKPKYEYVCYQPVPLSEEYQVEGCDARMILAVTASESINDISSNTIGGMTCFKVF